VARARALQTHGRSVESIGPGHRAAVALVGVEVDDVARGSVIVSDDAWQPSRLLRAEVALLEDAVPLGPRTRVRFHLGTAEVEARVVTPGGALAPGARAGARVLLEAPVPARAGDRFVLRALSPVRTVGGGVVLDPLVTHRRARPWPARPATPADALATLLAEEGSAGLAISTLSVRLGVSKLELARTLQADGVLRVGDRVFASASRDELAAQVLRLVAAHHSEQPLEAGVSLQQVRERLRGDSALVEEVLQSLAHAGSLTRVGGLLALGGWSPKLGAGQSRLTDDLVNELSSAGSEPPSVSELSAVHGGEVPALLRLLARNGVLVQVEPERYYAAAAVASLVERLRIGMERGRPYTPAELRELLGVSRKYLIPFLEYCDKQRVTARHLNGRVWGEI
jgi:selenocysteine-specific elongation factor